jgi:putative SOS response-associated peptidase YedK
MPVILRPEDYELWLDPGFSNPKGVTDLFKPFDPRRMKKYPVSTRVNRAENDDPECMREIVPAEPQPYTPSLFS